MQCATDIDVPDGVKPMAGEEMTTHTYIAVGVSCGVLLAAVVVVVVVVVAVLVRKRQSRPGMSMECRPRPIGTSLSSRAVSSNNELR